MEKGIQFGKRFVFAFSLMMAICFTVINPAWAGNANGPYVADELLVQRKMGVSKAKIKEIVEMHGAATAGEIEQIRVRRIKVPANALEKVKAALEKNPHISFVENNFFATGSAEPNDDRYPSQWHLPKISAPDGWDICIGSEMEPIAIIDSGVDPDHPDLFDKLVAGYNFVGDNTDTHDLRGHGTAVAGSAAALTDNVEGVAGVAWDNPIMPLVVLNSDNWASYYDIAQAITYAADQDVRVMNISIGGSSSSTTLQNAVNYAWNKGALIFACAMNNATSTPYYPAACTHVMAVSATTSNDTLASFSNYGKWIDIAAPGTSILTSTNGGGYGFWQGTSFSSPIAAGLAALILSQNSSLTNWQVADIMTENADDLGEPGFDSYYGYGRVNVYASLAAASEAEQEPDITEPLASITSPEGGSEVSGSVTVSVSATDDVGVERVELYDNGTRFAVSTTEPYSFYWETTSVSDGYHEVSARAYDTSENVGYSNAITVDVSNAAAQDPQDITPPTVSITSPADGSCISDRVTIQAGASDNMGVSRMEIYIDGVLKAAKSKSSITYRWNTRKVSTGEHIILAEAYDEAGNVGTDSITVNK